MCIGCNLNYRLAPLQTHFCQSDTHAHTHVSCCILLSTFWRSNQPNWLGLSHPPMAEDVPHIPIMQAVAMLCVKSGFWCFWNVK
jgi:hypothetical protein